MRWPWQREERQTGGSSGLSMPQDWLIDALDGSGTDAGERVTVKSSLGVIAVFAAVSKISETLGSLPLKVYQDVGDGERAPATGHRAYRMLHDMPNPLTPAHRFWSTVTAHLLLWGNSFIVKERNDFGLVSTLWLLDPANVEITWNEGLGLKRFFYTRTDGRREEVPADDVLHIMDFSLNGIVGESRIARCRQGLGTALARQGFEGRFYGRGAVLTGVIEYPGVLKDTARLRESWTNVYGGSKKAHQVGVLEEGATFKPLSAPLRDLQFVESAQLSKTDIAVLFGLPPAKLGGTTGDSLTYATVEGNRLEFADALAPVTNNIARSLTTDRGIFPFPSWFAEFEMKALMRGDSNARANYFKEALINGWMTVDEVRAVENLPPLPEDEEQPPEPAPDEFAADDAAPTNGSVPPALIAANGVPS